VARTILIHLNAELTDDDRRTADDVAERISRALDAVLLPSERATISIALAEEV